MTLCVCVPELRKQSDSWVGSSDSATSLTTEECGSVLVRGNRYVPFPFNLLKPTGHVMHQQFNIQQLYVLPTLYLCVLYLSENKQRLVPLTA